MRGHPLRIHPSTRLFWFSQLDVYKSETITYIHNQMTKGRMYTPGSSSSSFISCVIMVVRPFPSSPTHCCFIIPTYPAILQ